jgi:predicted ferric reductase
MRACSFFPILSLYILLPLIPTSLFLQASDYNLTLFIFISRIAGIYAFVWYALQFVVTARNQLMEWLVAQEKRMILHMLLAVGLLMIVVVHTGFGNDKYVSEIQAAAGGTAETVFLWATIFSGLFFSNYFIRFLPVIIPYRDKISEVIKLTHERCLLLHYAMPAGMVILVFHILLVPGQGLTLFKTCMLIIACGALSFFLYHKIILPRIMRNHPWTVAKVVKESNSIVSLYFDPPRGRKLKHHAGQFCYLRLLNGELPAQSHPFTISSGPEDERLSITVKQLGDFTTRLNTVAANDPVCIDGAYGDFTYTRVPSHHCLVFIAGGIGITPMLSMLKDLSIQDPKRKVILIWGARRETDLIRFSEVRKLSDQMGNFIFEPVLSRAPQWKGLKGHIDKTILLNILNNHRSHMELSNHSSEYEFFICGPVPMVSAVLQILKENKISNHRIHMERFTF